MIHLYKEKAFPFDAEIKVARNEDSMGVSQRNIRRDVSYSCHQYREDFSLFFFNFVMAFWKGILRIDMPFFLFGLLSVCHCVKVNGKEKVGR